MAPWFHDLELKGVRTAPNHPLGGFLEELWDVIAPVFPERLEGRTVLDVGCNAGFYSLRLRERGAAVTGIDHNPRYLEQARFAARIRGLDIDYRELDLYDVESLGRRYDYVLFMGVFYHLRHPLLGLERVSRVVGGRLVLQSLVRGAREVMTPAPDYPIEERAVFEDPRFPAMYFIEGAYAGDATNWWIPNDSCLTAMLRSCDLRIEAHLAPGIYVCEREER